jgi:AraC family transcriptional regulator
MPTPSTLRSARTTGVELVEAAYAPGVRMPRHAHPELSITLMTHGGVQESVNTRTNDASVWSICVKPAGVEHANVFSPSGARTISAKIDAGWLHTDRDNHPVTAEWRWITGGRPGAILRAILETMRDGRGDGVWVENAAIELVAALAGDSRLSASAHPPRWLSRVREQCIEQSGGGVRTARLAAEAGLHPVALARAFRRHFGESISECVRRARAQTALTLLQGTARPIADVAADSGCADQSHLTRLIRAETGMTPIAIRRLLGSDRSRHAARCPIR